MKKERPYCCPEGTCARADSYEAAYEEAEEVEQDLEFYDMIVHRGRFPERIQYNELEKAFADEWEQTNKRVPWLNSGLGTLELLLSERTDVFSKIWPLTQRDAFVAATVVQWFGTNIGFGFLQRCLGKNGLTIYEKGDSPEPVVSWVFREYMDREREKKEDE